MNAKEIIESGILHLYVSGSLTQPEKEEVEDAIKQYPEVKEEIEQIETSLMGLSKAVAPPLSVMIWSNILAAISTVKRLDNREYRTTWISFTGWAAAILCIGGIFWLMNQNETLEDKIELTNFENAELNSENEALSTQFAAATEILDLIRSKQYSMFNLPGNITVAPDAYAKVYMSRAENIAYIDAKGLPKAPEGKVYQVWSLKLDPLTPTSIGLLDESNDLADGLYKFENLPGPEAFGITLEPAGGSESPSLDQLYTLGTIPTAGP